MYEKRLKKEPIFSANNSKILFLLQELYQEKTHLKRNDLNEVIKSISHWKENDFYKKEHCPSEEQNKIFLNEIESILRIYSFFSKNVPDFDKHAIEKICNAVLAVVLQLADENFLIQYLEETKDILHNSFDSPILEDNDEIKKRVLISHLIVYRFSSNIEALNWPLDFPKSDLDITFIESHFDWTIIQKNSREWVNGQWNDINMVQAKDSKKGLFTFGLSSKDSLPKYLDIEFKYMPFPHKTFKLFEEALIENKINYTDNGRGWIRINDVQSKEKLALSLEILLRFAFMSPQAIKDLDSKIGCINPINEINDLVNSEEYDAAIELAIAGVKKGFIDCLWNLGELLKKKSILDKAFSAYASIEKTHPFYRDSRLKCFHILEQILFSNTCSEEEIFEYKERQFGLLAELCGKDNSEEQYEKLKDSLFSELCGNTESGIYGKFAKIIPSIDTLLLLAREMRSLKHQNKEFEKENKALKEEIQTLKSHQNAVVNSPKFFRQTITTNTTTTTPEKQVSPK